jgi:glucan 1,4-alpha-glucosidase
MYQKKSLLILSFLIAVFIADAQEAKVITESMGNIKLSFMLDENGRPQYSVYYKQKPVINPSQLGFILENKKSFNSNFVLLSSDKKTADETWKPVWGEVSSIRNHYSQFIFHLQEKNAPKRLLDIVFKVFEDGVGFRYEFPGQPDLKYFIITDETTQFNLTGDHKTFWIPGDYDSNEYPYTTSKLSEVDDWKLPIISNEPRSSCEPDQYAVQTPLMMKTADGLYINIHEAALVNYPSMQLHVNKTSFGLSSNLVPDAYGNKAYLRTPSHTPWRTIIVSDKATDILASKMILNLNEPSKIENTSWIQPMKFIGIWWEMQTGIGSWSYADNPDSLSASGALIPHNHHSANTANVKRYIDFASANSIRGLLVEGWNTGWEEWYGHWNGKNFDFVTPYPDFDVKEIENYSKQKGVQMIMHNETSGDAATYDQQMDTAFQFMNRFGYNSVKTGYVGKIIPRGEHHDGQWMANHYIRAAEKAVKYKVMIDMHEPVRPTGLSRTYPNWLACEAARGNEFNAFAEGSPPEHETILPFTRLMGGPMDYTPGIFKLKGYAKGAPDRQLHSTLAKQLALYVTMYSPLQMAADLPENYAAHMDAFQFIKEVAVDWDDSKIIAAEPGDYISIARKEKGKSNWFIGAVTDENSRLATLPLNFLDTGKKYVATIYADAENADWKTNPEAYKIEKFIVTSVSVLKIQLAAGGGAAVSIMPANDRELKKIKMYK